MITKEELEKYINKKISFKQVSVELNISYNTVLRYAKKYNLKSGIGTKGAQKHTINENYFEMIDTEEKAYWLGFIAADGNIHSSVKNKPINRLQINLKGNDIGHLKAFNSTLLSSYNVEEKQVNKYNVCQLKINSTKLCSDLQKLGITPRKSLNVEMPILPKELIKHFIRGYFDGDGNIKNFTDKNGRHRYNFNIVGGIDMLTAIKNNIPCETLIYNLKRQAPIYSLETTKKDNLITIYNYLYKNANIYLNRKKDIFDNLMSRFTEM
ncbi:MAG: hypothetical protein RR406_00225 [Bacilli bacterium]